MTVDQMWPFAVGFAIIVGIVTLLLRLAKANEARVRRMQGESRERMEALFRASFPELQPHFHPARVLEYVRARRSRVPAGASSTWRKPPGFPAAEVAEMRLEGMKDHVQLKDAKGARVAAFVYEDHPEGGVIRFGKGKFTVNLKGSEPRVRYWHPEREFKWTPSSWSLKSGVADQALASRSRDSDSWSDSSSSSSSPSATAAGAAAGAGIVAAGGTFDGGGASAAWDDGDSASSGSSSDSSPDFSSVESGSSSSGSSTSY